jgi:type III restriction enzyme
VAANPGQEEEIRRSANLHRARVRAAEPPSPAQRGEVFRIPQLSFDLGDSRELLVHESILVACRWSPVRFSCEFLPGEFDYDEKAHTFVFDLEGEQMRFRPAEAQVQIDLLSAPPPSDALGLSRWLVVRGGVEDKFVRLPDLLEFCRRCVDSLLKRGTLDLAKLFRAKYALAAALKVKLAKNREQAIRQGMQQLLAPEFGLAASFDFFPHTFPREGYAENIQAYSGPYRFPKHYYKPVRDLKSKGEELDCARMLERHPQVKWWVRNVDRQDGSFRLPLSNGHYFYPDFVAELTDGRLLVVEYKGGHLATGEDAKEKENIGKLWEERSGGKGVFRMLAHGEAI